MTGAEQLLAWTVAALSRHGIPYMVCGSVASASYGRPRSTFDVDIVVDPQPHSLQAFLAEIPSRVYVSREAARAALQSRGMFNVIDTTDGSKIDFILRKDRPFSVVELERRRRLELGGLSIFVASPEDVILSKLEWARVGGSQRQWDDALGIVQTLRDRLDLPYLNHWAGELGVADSWQSISRTAGLAQP